MLLARKGDPYPKEFPYKSKALLAFQKRESLDVCVFALYVQEYGSDCPEPNRNRGTSASVKISWMREHDICNAWSADSASCCKYVSPQFTFLTLIVYDTLIQSLTATDLPCTMLFSWHISNGHASLAISETISSDALFIWLGRCMLPMHALPCANMHDLCFRCHIVRSNPRYVHIWVEPPKMGDEYIFFARSDQQRKPMKREKLREWCADDARGHVLAPV